MSAAESTMKLMTSLLTLPLTKYLKLLPLSVAQILTTGSRFSFSAGRLLFDSFFVEVSRVVLVPDRVDADGSDVVARGGGAGRSDADEERGGAVGRSGAGGSSGAVGGSGAGEGSGAVGWSGALGFGGNLTAFLSIVFV